MKLYKLTKKAMIFVGNQSVLNFDPLVTKQKQSEYFFWHVWNVIEKKSKPFMLG